jgi:hypothetical protein
LWRLPQAGARRLQDTLSFAYEIHYFRFATQKSDVIELTNEQVNEIALRRNPSTSQYRR